MHGVGAVLKVVEVKETVLILHFASDRKQVYVTPNRLWGRGSVCVVTGLQAARSGVRIPAGARERHVFSKSSRCSPSFGGYSSP